MTTSQEQLRQLTGATAYDRDGDKIGRIGQVYFDDNTDQPKWITVNTGLFGMGESFVPLQGAQFDGDRVTLAYDKATVKDAPNVDGERHLDVEEEQQLYRHYGLDYGGGVSGERAGRHERRDDRAAGVVGDDDPARPGRPDRGLRHLRSDHRHRDDPLRGAPAGGHRNPGSRAGAAAQARGDRARAGHRPGVARGGSGRAGARSPTPTGVRPMPGLRSPRRSTRSPCARSGRW